MTVSMTVSVSMTMSVTMSVTMVIIMMMILLFRLHSCHFLCLEFLHNLSIVDLLTYWMTTVWTMTMDGLSLGIAGSTMAAMMIGSTLEESMMTAMRSMPVQNGPIIIFHQLTSAGNCN